jgi:hypothetical protein
MSHFKFPMFSGVLALLHLILVLCSWSNVLGEAVGRPDRDQQETPKKQSGQAPAADSDQRQLLKHDAQVKAITFVPQTNRILTLDCDGQLRAWDLKSGAIEFTSDPTPYMRGARTLTNDNHYYSALAVSSDGRSAAVCGLEGATGNVEIYDMRLKKKVGDIQPFDKFGAYAISFSMTGNRLAFAFCMRGALQWSLVDAKSLTPKKSAALPMDPKNPNWAIAVANLRGDNVMAVGLIRHTIAFYDTESGAEWGSIPIPVQQPKQSMFRPYQLAITNEGGLLLVVSRGTNSSNAIYHPDNMITLWDMTTGEHAWTFTHEKLHVGQAAFSPDGRYVAVGFLNDPDVRLYRIADNKQVADFRGHTKGVACIAFSPDGTMIASGSLDKTAIVWNVKEGLLAAADQPKADKDYAKCWDILRDGKPLEANEAVASLATGKDSSVKWLEGKLSPVRKPDADKVKKWLAQLNDDEPLKRDDASRELAALGPLVEEDVKKVLADKPDAEVKRRLEEIMRNMRSLWVSDRDTVRAIRSVYVLERIGSERAMVLLKKLAEGEPAARLTREAKISLERIEVRKPPKK